MPRPPTWKSGSTQRNRERPSTSRTSFAARALASRLSCARRAAFGVPVVPEVNSTAAGSPAGGMAAIDSRCTARSPGVRRLFSSTSSTRCSIAPRTSAAVCGVLCPSANIRGSRSGAGATSMAWPWKTTFTADRAPARRESAPRRPPARTDPVRHRPRTAARSRSPLQAAVRARAPPPRGAPLPRARPRPPPAQAPRRIPAPFRVEPQLDLGARRVSDHRRARVVAIETDLELERAVPVRPGALGLARQLWNARRREQQARRHFQGRGSLEQPSERNSGTLGVEIEHRLLHGAPGCRRPGQGIEARPPELLMAFGERFRPELRKRRRIAAADAIALVRKHEKAFADVPNAVRRARRPYHEAPIRSALALSRRRACRHHCHSCTARRIE